MKIYEINHRCPWTDKTSGAIICNVVSNVLPRSFYPRRFGPYVLIEPLEDGDGELDHVSLAFSGDEGMETLCVVRRLPRHLSDDTALLARFRDQANLARRVTHGN